MNDIQTAYRVLLERGIITKKTFMYHGPICPACRKRFKLVGGLGTWLNRAGLAVTVYALCEKCSGRMVDESSADAISDKAEKYLIRVMDELRWDGEER